MMSVYFGNDTIQLLKPTCVIIDNEWSMLTHPQMLLVALVLQYKDSGRFRWILFVCAVGQDVPYCNASFPNHTDNFPRSVDNLSPV